MKENIGSIDIRKIVEKEGGERRPNCAAEVYDINGYKMVVQKDKIIVRPKASLSKTKYPKDFSITSWEKMDYITFANSQDVTFLAQHLAKKENTIVSRKNTTPRGKAKREDGKVISSKKIKPNAKSILELDGWLHIGKKLERDGFSLQLTPNRIIVYPKGILVTLHYDKTFGTGKTGYDFIKVNQKTSSLDIEYLSSFLKEKESPSIKREKVKEAETQRKATIHNGMPKKSYCFGCPQTENTAKTCKFMVSNESTGHEYCSSENHWNTWYCGNADRKPFKRFEKSFPQLGYFMCKTSGQRCPYGYPTLLGDGYKNMDVENVSQEASILSLMHHMKGQAECPNYKLGRIETYKKITSTPIIIPKIREKVEDNDEAPDEGEAKQSIRRKSKVGRKAKVTKKSK